MIEKAVENKIPAESLFYHFALTSLAKTIAFRSMARVSLDMGEKIPAVITGYYALLHHAISLMYFCPGTMIEMPKKKGKPARMKEEVVKDWVNKIIGGGDPSDDVRHGYALDYLRSCQRIGLPSRCSQWFDKGKNMREYLNYAPRLHRNGGGAIFDTSKYRPSDFDDFVIGCDEVILRGLEWAVKGSNQPWTGRAVFHPG